MATNQSPVLNCNLQFQCPRQWDSFAETKAANVRFCTVCQKEVHLCLTTSELAAQSQAGNCVALDTSVQIGGASVAFRTAGVPVRPHEIIPMEEGYTKTEVDGAQLKLAALEGPGGLFEIAFAGGLGPDGDLIFYYRSDIRRIYFTTTDRNEERVCTVRLIKKEGHGPRQHDSHGGRRHT